LKKNKEDIFSQIIHHFQFKNALLFEENQSLTIEDSIQFDFILIKGIRENKTRFEYWNLLKAQPQFNYSIDYGKIGLIFKVENQNPKQHFTLN
jgi:hypothetical protein